MMTGCLRMVFVLGGVVWNGSNLGEHGGGFM